MLHNSYQYRGGEDESYESEVRMLRAEGHTVETIHVNNSGIESKGKFQVALESLWSLASYDLVDRKLSECSFDVLHVQNFFPQLSPSVYYAARKHGVAVVQTLRNYRLLCPGVFLYRDGHVCEDCMGKVVKYPGRHARLLSRQPVGHGNGCGHDRLPQPQRDLEQFSRPLYRAHPICSRQIHRGRFP